VLDLLILPQHNLIGMSADAPLTFLTGHPRQQVFPYDAQTDWHTKLQTQYATEAAVVQYVLRDRRTGRAIKSFMRMKGDSLPYIAAAIPRMVVSMEWLVLDWDLPSKGVRWGAPEKPETQQGISQFIRSHRQLQHACAYYFSKSGVRIIFKLANPLKIETHDDVLIWNTAFTRFVQSIDLTGVGGTLELKRDPFTLNRVPNYTLAKDDGSAETITGAIDFKHGLTLTMVYPPLAECRASNPSASGERRAYKDLPTQAAITAIKADTFLNYLRTSRISLSYNDWRALGTNIVATLRDTPEARDIFEQISQWDPKYNPASIEQHWGSFVSSVTTHGPVTWAQFNIDVAAIYGAEDPKASLAAKIRNDVRAAARQTLGGEPSTNVDAVKDTLTFTESKSKDGQVTRKFTNTLENLMKILARDSRWGLRIRRNHLGTEDLIDDTPIVDETITHMRVVIARDYGISYGKDDTWEVVRLLAAQNEFHPVCDYLSTLKWDGQDRVAGLAAALGQTDAFVQTLLRKFLISAVVRPLEWSNNDPRMAPNWKVDTVLVLKGHQGKRKSTFFKALCSDDRWFSDNLPSITHTPKDASMHMLGKWIVEQAEFEGHIARSSVENMKAFITREVENFRKPYGRGEIHMRRPSVLVGTTNSETFLNDPTGDRRFWVIEIPKDVEIDIAWVRANRDQLWAQARHLYEQGEAWWLTETELEQSNQNNAKFRRPDPLDEAMENFVNRKPSCAGLTHNSLYEDGLGFTLEQVATQVLDKQLAEVTPWVAQSVNSSLSKLGWVKVRIRVNGQRALIYRKLKNFTPEHEQGAQ
jgi:hypothetical protein